MFALLHSSRWHESGAHPVSFPRFTAFLADHHSSVTTIINANIGEPIGTPRRITSPHWAQSFSGLVQVMLDERSAMKVMKAAVNSRPRVRGRVMVVIGLERNELLNQCSRSKLRVIS